MKIVKYKIYLVILTILGATHITFSQTMPLGDSTTNSFLKVNFHSYIGKELYSLLLNDTVRKYYDEWEYMDYEKKYSLSGLYLNRKLAEGIEVGIEIFIDEYKYIEQVNFKENWDFNLLLKEKINGIRILLFTPKNRPAILRGVGDVPSRY